MKKLIIIVIIGLFMSSCSPYVNVGGEGGRCKVMAPRKFEKTRSFPSRSHPMYRAGVH